MPRGSERHTLIPWERSLKIDFRWLFSGDFSEETFSTLPFKLEKIHSTEFIMRIFWYKINDYENNIKSNRLYNKSAYYFCFRSLHSIWFCVPPLGMENTQRFLDTQFDLLLRPDFLFGCSCYFTNVASARAQCGLHGPELNRMHKTTTCHMTSHAAHSCAEAVCLDEGFGPRVANGFHIKKKFSAKISRCQKSSGM